MRQIKDGKILANCGNFDISSTNEGGILKDYKCRIRIVSRFPSDQESLDNLWFTLSVKHGIECAKPWRSAKTKRIGLTIEKSEAIQKLARMLDGVAKDHPRKRLIEAWQDACNYTTPRIRARLQPGERYRPSDWTEQREAAINRLIVARRACPPLPLSQGES